MTKSVIWEPYIIIAATTIHNPRTSTVTAGSFFDYAGKLTASIACGIPPLLVFASMIEVVS